MATTRPRVPWSRWSTKQYIIAALLGMLAMVAAAAAISISLAPAQIAFSVRNARITHIIQVGTTEGGKQPHHFFWYYNLTLVANNPSHRTAVSYGSLTVDIWRSETAWIPTEDVNASAALPGWLPPGTTTLVKVGVEGGQYNEETPAKGSPPSPPPPPPPPPLSPMPAQGPSSNMVGVVAKWPYYRVVVAAKVWFRFAGVPTMPYNVRVSCFPVDFVHGTSGPVNCTG